MNEPNNNIRKTVLYLLIFVIGGIVGAVVRDMISHLIRNQDKSGYVERHEGQNKYINPLLACDAAEDVIRNTDLIPFKEKIEQFLNTRMDKRLATKVGVYYRELNDGNWFSIGESEKFIPASMRKVPLMIALLKQAESDPALLGRQVTFDLSNDYNLNQNFKPSQTLLFGKKYAIKDLIYRMIVYSDNNAFTYLTKVVDPAQFDTVYSNLRLQNPGVLKDDEFLSVQTYESFFRILYNASYLTRDASQWALDVLSKSEFRTGLVAGVPQNVKVSHKFGEKSEGSDGAVQLHDCGIVYYPRHPYLLCVMTRGANFELLDDVIANISQITFTEVDRQHSNH
ncbi:MAG: class A beta-lactamase-related serine hydrolase [Desulfuromonadaceae bacterium]|nr:class A beta-lactamase-related serine hydrolase [Desulfuromonadaceae bacterium]